MKTGRKRLDEIFRMTEGELLQYLREMDEDIQVSDSIQIVSFDRGIRAFYYHRDSTKPYKTRVFLANSENSDLSK